GNGDTGNQGPHQFDIARWGLNKNEHPVTIYSNGGLYGWSPDECAQETPDTQTSLIKYKDGSILEFETRGGYSNGESGLDIRIGNVFYGTEGYLELNGETWNAYRKRETKPFAGTGEGLSKPVDPTFRAAPGSGGHYGNFIQALKSDNNNDLNCDINEGYYSTALPLLANISYRLKRELHFMGGDLDNERFIGDPEANVLLTRNYRHPYIVSEI